MSFRSVSEENELTNYDVILVALQYNNLPIYQRTQIQKRYSPREIHITEMKLILLPGDGKTWILKD